MYGLSSKILSMLLIAAIFIGLTACGSPGAQQDTTAAVTTQGLSEAVTENLYADNLPEKDFGGYEFKIFTRQQAWYHGEWLAEEENGEILNDAIFKRNSTVAERFNISFSEVCEGNTDTARNTILAGDDAYDVINARCSVGWTYAEESLIYKLKDLPYIDLSKAYWDSSLNEYLTICGEKYFAVGANNLTSYDYTHVLVFNKEIVENNKLDNPYDIVKSGKWTLDAFDKAVKNITNDINGDSVMDDKDSYGFLSQPKAVLPGFWIGSNVLSVNKNSSDEPVFTMPTDIKFLDVFDIIYKITWDNKSWFVNESKTNNDAALTTMFQDNKSLFMDMTFYYIESLRDMDANFGIIPYPKYDENQNDYLSRIEGCEFTCVPVTAADPERTSVILEAIASESAKSVLPAYYDIALKTKYTRDDESMEMLDIIFNNRVFDLGDTIWCDQLRDGVFRDMFSANDRAISSKFASMQTVMNEKINATVKAFK